MAGVTAAGFESKSVEEIAAEIRGAVSGGISTQLDLSSTSPFGQLIDAVATQIAQTWEAAQANYTAKDIEQAADDSLNALAKLHGTSRRAATPSTVLLTLNLSVGFYTAGTLAVNVAGDPTIRFTSDADINVLSPSVLVGVPFTCDTLGPLHAGAGTLTEISDPVVGFNSATNPLDATLGSDIETDAALRSRLKDELARKGSATVDAIRADVLAVSDFVRVYENEGDGVDANGLPGHSFEVLVLGGTDADIADAIFNTKPAGIQAYGSTVVTVTDSQGSGHAIGFTRPDDVEMYVDVTLSYLAGRYLGSDALKAVLVDWADANLAPGTDVLVNRLVQVVMDELGVVDCTIKLDDAPLPSASVNFPIGVREIARFDVSRITVTSTAVVGVP